MNAARETENASRETAVPERGLRWRGLAWLSLCGPWFFIAYGFCNWFTSRRTDVGTWYWEWEKRVPFVPELVVPYWSLDLLFVIAFFLPRTKDELRILGTRIFAIITLTSVCFLIWPLKFDLPRPMPTRWTAPFFRALYANDLPFNLAPSLHIGLRCLFWITYGRHMRGWARTAMRHRVGLHPAGVIHRPLLVVNGDQRAQQAPGLGAAHRAPQRLDARRLQQPIQLRRAGREHQAPQPHR